MSSDEKQKYCPECYERGKVSRVKRYQFNNMYVVLCQDIDDCFFQQECEGLGLVNEGALTAYGFPEELLQHVDIYHGDLTKIVYLCYYEYFKKTYTSGVGTMDEVKEVVELAKQHNVVSHIWPPPGLCLQQMVEELISSLEESLSDFPLSRQEKIKNAFSKINNYNFPNDFVAAVMDGTSPLMKM